jgi:hypothetical protein
MRARRTRGSAARIDVILGAARPMECVAARHTPSSPLKKVPAAAKRALPRDGTLSTAC